MTTELFPNFLSDPTEYSAARQKWLELWSQVDPLARERFGWRQPWMSVDALSDGNPIFTAFSPSERKGVRVIQFAQTPETDEFHCWYDTFGGSADDPDAIHELVISCALSNRTASLALQHMDAWVRGETSTTLDQDGSDR